MSEKAPQAGDRLPGPHQHFPWHRAGRNAVSRPCSAGSVWGHTPCRVATHDGSRSSHRSTDRERRPGGHRARHGRRVTQHIGSAKAVRIMSTPVHHLMPTSPWAQSQSRIGPGAQPRCESGSLDVEPRGAAPPISVVEPIQGLWVRRPRCSHGARSSDPAVGDRERRPGGHRARHGRLGDTADRLSGSGTDHVHTVALEDVHVTFAG